MKNQINNSGGQKKFPGKIVLLILDKPIYPLFISFFCFFFPLQNEKYCLRQPI